MNNIRAIILDVDGVLLGTKYGTNFPEPHKDVMNRIRSLSEQGIIISLCSAKPAVGNIALVRKLNLDTMHVGSNGMEIFNPIQDQYSLHQIDHEVALQIVDKALGKSYYTEVFTPQAYHIPKHQKSFVTGTMNQVRNMEAVLVDDLHTVMNNPISRMSIAVTTPEKEAAMKLLQTFSNKIDIHWSTTPLLPDHWFAIISTKGISKESGVYDIARITGVPLEETLAVGDGINDWNFIKVCGFGAAMGNAHEELKVHVRSMGKRGYIGPHVDDNGLLDIFDHFLN